MIDFDGTVRRCTEHPDADLPTEEAAVRHLHEAHPELWRQANSLDLQLVPSDEAPTPNRAERRAAARREHGRRR